MAVLIGDCPPLADCISAVTQGQLDSVLNNINTAYAKFTHKEWVNLFGENQCYCQGSTSATFSLSAQVSLTSTFQVQANGSLASSHCSISVGGNGSTQDVTHSSVVSGSAAGFCPGLYAGTLVSSSTDYSYSTKFFNMCGWTCTNDKWNDCSCFSGLSTTDTGSGSLTSFNPHDAGGQVLNDYPYPFYFNMTTGEFFVVFDISFLLSIAMPVSTYSGSPSFFVLERCDSNSGNAINLSVGSFSVFSKPVINKTNLKWQKTGWGDTTPAYSCDGKILDHDTRVREFAGSYDTVSSFNGSISVVISKT